MTSRAAARIDHVGLNLPAQDLGLLKEMLEYLGFRIEPDGEGHFDAHAGQGESMVCVHATKPPFGPGYHRKNTGLSHLAVRVPSRDAVDDFVTGFLAPRGITPLYRGAQEYDYTPGYYAVFVETEHRVKFEVMTSDDAPEPAAPGAAEAAGVIQHGTASVFVLRHAEGVWRLLLIMHERLGALTIPGGHIDALGENSSETAAEAGVREVREEAGQEIVLLAPPAPRMPAGFPHAIVAAPWLTVRGHASPDGVSSRAHAHIDHQFLALAAGPAAIAGECEPLWLRAEEIEAREDILPDTKMQALLILAALERVGGDLAPEDLARDLHRAVSDL